MMGIFIVGLATVLVLASSQTSNCGGNTAALAVCGHYPLYLFAGLAERDETSAVGLTPNALTAGRDSDELSSIFQSLSATASYSIRNPDVAFDPADREVVIVCEQAFENVPQPTVWNLYCRSPAHAVGYSDGSTGLISPAEYRELDRSDFMPAADWIRLRATSAGESPSVAQ
ncbi:hypothetical protein [Roseimaritima ulvae]|uniref:Uncharacterized protein n=1 Tax=Roseimaritima ulvae TaxID=980254 RepID=A0A5B9R8Z1_9BACT|nr:hypothetical protein [Roseimaritima ulvae]QEG43371.1 hypothetical protein UC8_54180 [Roseimaritima ulvae]